MSRSRFWAAIQNRRGMGGGAGATSPRKAGSRTLPHLAAGLLATAMLLTTQTPAGSQQRASQQRVAGPGETQFNLQLLRPSGGPVVPIFEGWYPEADGTHQLSFGYFNVNTEEILEIPLGPDNFIEPGEFDGLQPTFFLPVPEGDRRHWGVFTVRVPEDFTDRDVVWTLRIDGRTYSVPGRLTSSHYQINARTFPGRPSESPVLKLDADGPEGMGPAGVSTGPLEADVGHALRISVWATRGEAFPDDLRPIRLKWFKHQGPGEVMFDESEVEVASDLWKGVEGGARVDTDVTFSEPGRYVLRALAYNTIPEFEFQCCWTNGYVHVVVSP